MMNPRSEARLTRDRRTIAEASPVIATLAFALALAAGCSSAPPPPPRPIKTAVIPVHTAAPQAPTAPQREPPPPSGPALDLRVPEPSWAELPSGLKVAMVASRALPIVQIRVVVLSGSAADGERPGLAALTAELLKSGGAGAMAGREVLSRVESLGADLSVRASFDRITLGLGVTKDLLGEALDLLGAIVTRPQLSPTELAKLKKRAVDRAASKAQEDSDWAASMVLFRDLFALPSDRHPYASFDATADELSKLTAVDCRAFYTRHFIPKNTFVVIAGDTSSADVKAAVVKAFAGYVGGERPVTSFTDPVAPESLKVTLVDRPKSAQSAIYAGTLGPMRADKDWPAFLVASQILGGNGTGRLSTDVRDKQGLASAATSSIVELAGAPAVFYAHAKTDTPKTGLALRVMLDHIARLDTEAPAEAEVEAATRSLVESLAIRVGSVSDVADAIVNLRTLSLWDDYYGTYQKALREVTPVDAAKVSAEHLRSGHAVVVVAGDAEVVGPMLSHFAEVKVVDATKGFQRIRTISMNADAPLKPARVDLETP